MSIYELGFDNSLTKQSLFGDTVQSTNSFTGGIASQVIQSGDMSFNANLVDGYLQSSNFVTGSAGWQITADGDVEFSSGTFRGSITGASGTFGNMTLNVTTNALIVNDGTNDRVLIGYYAGLF